MFEHSAITESRGDSYSITRGSQKHNQKSELYDYLSKIYITLMNNQAIKMSFEQFKALYESISSLLQGNTAKISYKLSNLISTITVYNQLVKVWLYQNLPHAREVKPYENFVASFRYLTQESGPIPEEVVQNFYSVISSEWSTVRNASSTKLKDFILRIVAKVMNKELGFSDEVFANALFNTFKTLSQEKSELLNQKLFRNGVWNLLDEGHKSKGFDVIQKASNEYYNFAKRFIIIDFPKKIESQGLVSVTKNLIKDRLFYLGDSSLSFFERNVDFLMKLVNVGYAGPKDASSIIEKSERILKKMFVLALLPVKYTSEKALEYKQSSPYITIDKYVNLTAKLEEVIYYTMWGYDILKLKVMTPVYEFVKINFDKTKSLAIVSFEGLNSALVKKNIVRIRNNYEVLKRSLLIIQNRLVNFVLDGRTVQELGESIKTELIRLYTELKGFETEKVKAIGLEYYQWILKGYKKAQREAIEIKNEVLGKEAIEQEKPVKAIQEKHEERTIEQERIVPEDKHEEKHGEKRDQVEFIQQEVITQKVEVQQTQENKAVEEIQEKEIKALSEENREGSTENEENNQGSDENDQIEKEVQLNERDGVNENAEKSLSEQDIDAQGKGSQEIDQDGPSGNVEKKKKKKKNKH